LIGNKTDDMLAGASMFTGFMLKRANEKMRDLNDAGRSRSGIETAAGGHCSTGKALPAET
jgi:hypothetical protein